jgi:predicted nucleotidyltransferase
MSTMASEFAIEVPTERLAEFAKKWRIVELSLFGSVVNGDFREDSDVDVLVKFEDEAPWSLSHIIEMKWELEELFGRDVDIVERDVVKNPFVRKSIFSTRRIVYAA